MVNPQEWYHIPGGGKRLVRAGVNPTTQVCVAHAHYNHTLIDHTSTLNVAHVIYLPGPPAFLRVTSKNCERPEYEANHCTAACLPGANT